MHDPSSHPSTASGRSAHLGQVARAVDALCNSLIEAVAERLSHVDTNPVPTSPYMSVAEAADYARCSTQRIYDLRSDRTLGDHGDGRKALVLRAELDAYLRSRPGGK